MTHTEEPKWWAEEFNKEFPEGLETSDKLHWDTYYDRNEEIKNFISKVESQTEKRVVEKIRVEILELLRIEPKNNREARTNIVLSGVLSLPSLNLEDNEENTTHCNCGAWNKEVCICPLTRSNEENK